MKAKLYNLGLSLKDNAHSQLPVAVSSLSSKAPIINPAPTADSVSVNEVALELKTTGPLPSVEEKLQVLECCFGDFDKICVDYTCEALLCIENGVTCATIKHSDRTLLRGIFATEQ